MLNPESILGRDRRLTARGDQGRPQPDAQRSGARDLSLAHRRRSGARQELLRAARTSAPRCAASAPATATRSAASYAVRLGDLYRDNLPRADRAHRRGQESARSPGSNGEGGIATVRCRRRSFAEYQRLRRAAASRSWPTRRPICSTPSKPASGCCSKGRRGAARHRPRHVPLRHQQQQLGRRRVQRLGRAGAMDQRK